MTTFTKKEIAAAKMRIATPQERFEIAKDWRGIRYEKASRYDAECTVFNNSRSCDIWLIFDTRNGFYPDVFRPLKDDEIEEMMYNNINPNLVGCARWNGASFYTFKGFGEKDIYAYIMYLGIANFFQNQDLEDLNPSFPPYWFKNFKRGNMEPAIPNISRECFRHFQGR